MTSDINAIFSDNAHCQHLSELFSRAVQREFCARRRVQLVEYMSENAGGGDQAWEMARKAAAQECWDILCSLPPSVKSALEEALEDLREGHCTLEDVSVRVCRAVVCCLANRVAESQRDWDYAGLRQAIARRKHGDTPAFFTLNHKGLGICFAPQPVEEVIPDAPRIALTTPPAALGAVDPAIRKPQTATTANTSQMEWDSAAVEREARRFWQAYVGEHYAGRPGFVPLYAMYCWIRKTHDLGRPQVLSLNASVATDDANQGNAAEMVDYLPASEHLAPDKLVAQAEILDFAKDFVSILSEREAKVFAWYFEPGITLEDVARALGLAGPSSLNHYKKDLLEKLRKHMTQLCDETADVYLFIETAEKKCKERFPAPIAKEQEG